MIPLQKYTFSIKVQSFFVKNRILHLKTNPAVSHNELAAGCSRMLYINLLCARAKGKLSAAAFTAKAETEDSADSSNGAEAILNGAVDVNAV